MREKNANLVRRLSELPLPPIPPGLDQKLLTAIATETSAGRAAPPSTRRRAWPRIVIGGAIAAAIVLLVTVLPIVRNVGNQQATNVPERSHSSKKETRPCDILPPLPRPF
jgi:hypothetical protein